VQRDALDYFGVVHALEGAAAWDGGRVGVPTYAHREVMLRAEKKTKQSCVDASKLCPFPEWALHTTQGPYQAPQTPSRALKHAHPHTRACGRPGILVVSAPQATLTPSKRASPHTHP
jgi:hypothetical protein